MRITANIVEEDAPQASPKVEDVVCVFQGRNICDITQKVANISLSDSKEPRQNLEVNPSVCASQEKKKRVNEGASTSTPNRLFTNAVGQIPSTMDMALQAWLNQYLAKMKQDIKKEILEELSPLGLVESKPLSLEGITSEGSKWEECDDHVVHTGIFCDNCDQLIHGIRYKCGNCSDFDLCQECESLPNIHNKNHIFLKIRFPLAPKHPLPTPRNTKKVYYKAVFIKDETVPDGTQLPPGTEFVKSWRVRNNGRRMWTHETKLHFLQGSPSPHHEHVVDIPPLMPGEEGVVSVVLQTPLKPGVHRSHWNFMHRKRPFGDIVWCQIVVAPAAAKPETEEKEAAAQIAEVLTAVKKEHERGNLGPRKLALNSQTATPNNTPFDLSPPKSPDHHSASYASNLEKVSSETESDTEFVVIPMPKCFDMSDSLISRDLIEQHPFVLPPPPLHAGGVAVKVSQETGVPDPPSLVVSSSNSSSSSEISILTDSPPQHEVQEESSVTFPKFPIADIEDHSPTTTEERSVQVLPEGLVTGALSAAATFYNTAKSVISNMQQPKPDYPQRSVVNFPQLTPCEQLVEMGFSNRHHNEQLLRKHDNDIALVVAELVAQSDNDWYKSRHTTSPAPPPEFD